MRGESNRGKKLMNWELGVGGGLGGVKDINIFEVQRKCEYLQSTYNIFNALNLLNHSCRIKFNFSTFSEKNLKLLMLEVDKQLDFILVTSIKLFFLKSFERKVEEWQYGMHHRNICISPLLPY